MQVENERRICRGCIAGHHADLEAAADTLTEALVIRVDSVSRSSFSLRCDFPHSTRAALLCRLMFASALHTAPTDVPGGRSSM